MPVFVTCPACGCRVQMSEAVVGKSVRCFGCDSRFTADPNYVPPPRRAEPPSPRPEPPPPRGGPPGDETAPDGRPFCPGCGRKVNWEWVVCYHCGEPFDLDPDPRARSRAQRRRPRRDCLPHRGPLIAMLGNLALVFGALSLCIVGAGALVSVPLGIVALVMAQTDLAMMRAGQMDPQGRQQTESGRLSAVVGIALGAVFAAGWALFSLGHF